MNQTVTSGPCRACRLVIASVIGLLVSGCGGSTDEAIDLPPGSIPAQSATTPPPPIPAVKTKKGVARKVFNAPARPDGRAAGPR